MWAISGKETDLQGDVRGLRPGQVPHHPYGYIPVIVIEETWKGPDNTITQLT